MKSVTVKWAKKHADEINLIDVRSEEEFKAGHIKGAKNIPMFGLLMNHKKFLNKDETYYLMCYSGARSSNTISNLEHENYDLINVEGGWSLLEKIKAN